MIYTLGKISIYEPLLAQRRIRKLGKRGDYPGGCVYRTHAEALTSCPEEYRVYGLLADWDRDTYEDCNGKRSLLRNSRIVRCSELYATNMDPDITDSIAREADDSQKGTN